MVPSAEKRTNADLGTRAFSILTGAVHASWGSRDLTGAKTIETVPVRFAVSSAISAFPAQRVPGLVYSSAVDPKTCQTRLRNHSAHATQRMTVAPGWINGLSVPGFCIVFAASACRAIWGSRARKFGARDTVAHTLPVRRASALPRAPVHLVRASIRLSWTTNASPVCGATPHR